eukprot:CAMPEP_0170495314 /NCGR_PEP_ID=MMETSP0208-20121228/15135_1 /TAXON_ID=197538 /ORGANISM="Strombidium inclinatum, Strain S3" /LENGTH=104 /DNA_ID=CAMNT_0010771485 /DNA_START=525 /DNA_END=839 /DNA_ORIENTATION=-
MKTGEIPNDVVEKVDMDRINEDSEDFLEIDRKRPVAIEKQLTKPINDMVKGRIIERTIIGGKKQYNETKVVLVEREQKRKAIAAKSYKRGATKRTTAWSQLSAN